MEEIILDLSKLNEISFEPIKEPWNEYKLKNNTILRFRLIAVKFFDTGKIDPLTGCPNYILAYQNILSVKSQERGRPTSTPVDLSKVPNERKKEIEIEKVLNEDWSVYIVDNKYQYEVKPCITTILKLDGYFDPAGYPVYHVRSENISKVRKIKQ